MGAAVQNRDWLGQSALHFRERLILAKPDPALGYFNSELRLWLGWAQEVAGNHGAARCRKSIRHGRIFSPAVAQVGKTSFWRSILAPFGCCVVALSFP